MIKTTNIISKLQRS